MKKTKLKKKVKHSQIIFPSTYISAQKNQEIIGKKQEKILERRFHRILSRDKLKEKTSKSLFSRSLSVNQKIFIPVKDRRSDQTNLRTRNLSVQKRCRRGNSAVEISKIYYDNLQKKLVEECEMIIKQQHPKDKLQSYKIERLSNNLLRIKQKEKPQQFKSIVKISVKGSQPDLNTMKDVNSQMSIIQNLKLQDFMKDFKDYKEMTKKQVSNIDISISGKSIEASQQELFEDYRHHNSLLNNLDQSQQSVFKSQVNSSLIEILEKTPIFFFSPKFSIKYTTFFQIFSLKIIPNQQQKTFEMQIFLHMYNEIIFKKISFKSMQQKKSDNRTRKGHLRRVQMIREKIKERVLSNFTRQYSEQLIIEFYQDLIFYLEHFIIFQKTYRGLVFIDRQQNSLQLKNHQKIFEILKIHKSFYFILKLNYTFYIVKVILTPQMEIKFTFTYDFTTHSAGDQLFFTYPSPQKLRENKTEAQTYKIFLKVIDDFVEMITSEWKCQFVTNKQILQKESSAKISQITTGSLERWDSSEVHGMSNINKEYHLMDGLTNFFQFHDQFDYGFFSSPHYLLINGKYNYILDDIQKTLPVYVYPHTYIYLELTQIQKQMIVIPHINTSKYQKHTEKAIHDFFHRQISKNYKKRHEFFTLFIGRKQIRMKQKDLMLDIYISFLNNLRCQRLSIPISQFPSYNKDRPQQLDMKKASIHVENVINRYRVEKSFLYSKFTQQQTSKLIIYHKGLQKLERQFVFITLYGLPLLQIVQFKIFMFRFGREFIIRFDSIDWLNEINLKDLISNLLELIKSIYFKRLIQEQARKSKKRRLDTLEVFLKKHGKSYVNQARSKKKLDEQIKRRMMRLANFKENNINTLVYENIVTDYFQLTNGKQFLVTVRFVPSEEFRQQNEWKNQSIQICVHRSGMINYFKFVTSMKQLIYSASQGKLSLQHIDFRQVHHFFKEIKNKIKQIIKASHRNFDFVISSLKHFLVYNYQTPSPIVYPFKFKLVENILFETKDSVNPSDQVQSQISIQLQMEKPINLSSNNNLIFSPYLGTELKQQMSTNFSFGCRKPVNHPYKRFIDQTHIIQMIDIFRKSEDYRLLKEYNLSNREIWITDRETGSRSILNQWDIGFLSSINFGQFNQRLFRRLLKSLRPAF